VVLVEQLPSNLSLITAFSLGVVHALEPGHGKGIIATYILGSRANWLNIIGIASVMAVSHLAITLILVSLVLWLGHHLPNSQQQLMDTLHYVSPVLMIALGLSMVWRTLTAKAHPSPHCTKTNNCCPKPQNSTLPSTTSPYKELALVGLASGLRPCPFSLGVLLTALQVGQWQQWPTSLGFVMSFSIAMGLVLSGIGLVIRYGATQALAPLKQHPWWHSLNRQLTPWIPLTSASLIIISGIWLLVSR
jgi:nickel/cobalt transporter (NicO) family protein